MASYSAARMYIGLSGSDSAASEIASRRRLDMKEYE
jgi:hypothetical protein